MYVRLEYPLFAALDNNGMPAVDYEVWTYEAGTSTALTTYTDRLLTTPNTNPIVLDSRGECRIYVGEATKLVLTIPDGDPTSPIWTFDWLAEQQNTMIIVGTATAGTTNNNYVVDVVPPFASIPDELTLVWKPDVNSADSIVSTVFTPSVNPGTHINDAIVTGPYIGTTTGSVFTFEIDGTAPDTFRWKKDGGAWHTLIPITGVAQTIIEGIVITFAEMLGHTLGDIWATTVKTPARLNFCGLGNKLIYKNLAGVLTPLGANDLIVNIPAMTIYSQSQDAWILTNPSLPVLSYLIPLRRRKNLTANYNVTINDQGTILSCVGTFNVTFPNLSTIPHTFYYVLNHGTGVISIKTTGGQLIYGPGDTTGVTTFTLGPNTYWCVQLETNGVNLLINTVTEARHGHWIASTGSGNFTVSAGVYKIWVNGAGGGGAGGADSVTPQAGGGGGGAQCAVGFEIAVVPGAVHPYVIGGGGVGVAGGAGGGGGTTSLGAAGVLLTLTGGSGGTGASGGAAGGDGGAAGNDPFNFIDAALAGPINIPGAGGSCIWGPGGQTLGGVPQPGDRYGGGGSGANGAGTGGHGGEGFLEIFW